jgi:hypothetical protein
MGLESGHRWGAIHGYLQKQEMPFLFLGSQY